MNIEPQPTDWLVSVKPMDSPVHREAGPHAEGLKQVLRDQWSAAVAPLTGHGTADYEDFYEQAAKLSAALAVGADRIWVDVHDGSPRNAATGVLTTSERTDLLRRWGSQHVADDRHPQLRVERMADNYASLATFRRLAGRTVILAGFNVDGATELAAAIRQAAGAQGGRVFVKVNRQKYGIFEFDVPAAAQPQDIADLIFHELGFTLIHLEGEADAFIVQAAVTMEYEYRLFVVDHQVVAGAGCVEEFTPLDNEDTFDSKVCRERRGVSAVESRPALVDQLVAFGREAAAAIAIEWPDLHNYGLDLALGADGRPLVVELNTLLNSGLYASDVRQVFLAMDAAPASAI